jgi:ATP-binding cassette subfamily F protein 3
VGQRPNLLLLDEPTNHLDLDTREALTVALAQFEGTLVLVSHDRHLLRATTDQFMIVADGRLRPFDGDLDDYRDWLLEKKGIRSLPSMEERPKRPSLQAARGNLSARKPIESRIQRIEREMAKLNARKAEIEAQLADPALYAEASKDKLKGVLLDQAYLGKELDLLETEWLQKQGELDALT